jgi:hypothetical protein
MCVLELLPFLCFRQPVFSFRKFHCFFGKRSPLTAHDFQRCKFISTLSHPWLPKSNLTPF